VNRATANKVTHVRIAIRVRNSNFILRYINLPNVTTCNRLVTAHAESSVLLRMLTVSVHSSIVRKSPIIIIHVFCDFNGINSDTHTYTHRYTYVCVYASIYMSSIVNA